MTGNISTENFAASCKPCHWCRLAVIWLLSIVPGHAPGADAIELIVNQVAPPNHFYHMDVLIPWANDVARVTDGRVSIKFSIAPMGSYRRNFDMAKAGMIDIAGGNQSATPGRFIVTQVNESPFHGGESVEAISVALWNTHNRYLFRANEFAGTKLLALHASGTMFLYTTETPVRRLQDLRGLKIAAPSDVGGRVLASLEAVPVFLTAPELRDSLSRGIIDGLLMSYSGITRLGLTPYLHYQTPLADQRGLSFGGFFLVANDQSWERLSAADQAAIMRVSGERFVRRAGQVFDEVMLSSRREIKASGIEIVQPDADFDANLRQALRFMDKDWLVAANGAGVEGDAALAFFRAEVGRLSKLMDDSP